MSIRYDLLVIGSGPAGEHGAIEAARLGKSVVMIDSRLELGGNCCHTGTLPSKTLRESSLVLSRALDHAFLPPIASHDEHPVTMAQFMYRAQRVMAQESQRVRTILEQAGISIIAGSARFTNPHTLQITNSDGSLQELYGERILIACGSRPVRPKTIPFDGQRVFDSDQILQLQQLPKSIIVVGGGVIGSEYASIFSNLGIPVHLLEARPIHLPFIDQEIIAQLHAEMRKRSLTLDLGVSVTEITTSSDCVSVKLSDERTVTAEALFYTLGRMSNADTLDLSRAGIVADERFKISVDKDYHTNVPHIAAAGDVIGFPSLASTSADQGKAAVRELFGFVGIDAEKLLPYGIYTIPEVSTVGATEIDAGTPTIVGRCRLADIARGIISGDDGLLKLVFSRTTRRLLGAHCVGSRATDIIHTAMFCIRLGGTVDDIANAIFNYPTISSSIKNAALDALSQFESPTPSIQN